VDDQPTPEARPDASDATHPQTGEVIEFDWSSQPGPPGPTEKSARKVEDTRANLAYALVGLLALTVIGLFALLISGGVPADSFAEVAGIMVSPLIGLVGAVTGYYYGKADQR
jgi:hypothetical protein